MRIEAFQSSHLEQVVDLYRTINAGVATRAHEDVEASLRAMLLDFPGNEPGIDSLVTLDGSEVIGFLGVIPRRWRIGDGRRVLGVTLTGLIVSERHRNGFAAAGMIRCAMKQRHELIWSDRPTNVAVKLVSACGGFSPVGYGFGWRRDRGLWTAAVSRVADRFRWGRLGRAVRIAEGPLRRLGRRTKPSNDTSITVRTLTAADIAAVLRSLGPQTVAVDDDDVTWAWLLRYLDGQSSRGRMRARSVRGADGSTLGFWIYFARPDASAEVLSLVASAPHREVVLAALAHALDEDELSSAYGTACVVAMPALLGWGAHMVEAQPAALYTRDAEIAAAFREGRAMITGLESEAWV